MRKRLSLIPLTTSFRPLNGIQWLTLVLVAFVASGFIYGFHLIRSEQVHQNDAIQSIMCRAEHVVKKTPASPQFTKDEKFRAIRFYRRAIKDAHLAPCSETPSSK